MMSAIGPGNGFERDSSTDTEDALDSREGRKRILKYRQSFPGGSGQPKPKPCLVQRQASASSGGSSPSTDMAVWLGKSRDSDGLSRRKGRVVDGSGADDDEEEDEDDLSVPWQDEFFFRFQDQFDVLDLSDNEIRKVDGFPTLKRLKCIMLNNNRIVRIAAALGESLPNLQALILSNNHLQELSDLEPLGNIPSLEIVSLLHNPVVHKPHYRSYVITLLPELRILDFRRVKLAERKEAEKLFKSKKGKEMKRKIETAAKTFVPGGEIETNGDAPPAKKPAGAASTAEMRRIKQMIANATSLEEVERLNLLLQKGQLNPETAKTGNGDSEMDAE
ncbi:unnamed protein product [Notodromas monacha]|uniref:U2A'/phosphoprotein 32 family A C-terminal domain-containing protein n=1 Tax=Notodromas monacha TaxID=399045 RepID=A0A7R9G9M8_9CRUS|nr:unnamed protein product [Notodromas monacha]CAG0914377.1 unnamed protein product [Notodromas monacha]